MRIRNKRYTYAQGRYEDLTGWKAPLAGGPPQASLSGARRRIDGEARLTVSRELGHARLVIATRYLGE